MVYESVRGRYGREEEGGRGVGGGGWGIEENGKREGDRGGGMRADGERDTERDGAC